MQLFDINKYKVLKILPTLLITLKSSNSHKSSIIPKYSQSLILTTYLLLVSLWVEEINEYVFLLWVSQYEYVVPLV